MADVETLDPVQDAVLSAARAALPELRVCKPYEGEFGPEGPTKGVVSTPGFFLAAVEAPPADVQPGDGRLALEVRWQMYCLARNARGSAERGRDAMALAARWAQVVQHNAWGMAHQVEQAELEQVQNLYTADLDKKGFAMWVVTWRQVVQLGPGIWDGDEEVPDEIWVGQDGESFPGDYEQQDT